MTWTLRAQQVWEHILEAWIGTFWIVELSVVKVRVGRAFRATHLFLSSMCTAPEAMLKLVRDRWSIEDWH